MTGCAGQVEILVGSDNEANLRIVPDRIERFLELGKVADFDGLGRNPQRRTGGFDLRPTEFELRAGHRVEQDCGASDAWRNLLDDLQPFLAQRRVDIGEAGGIAARA